MTSSPTASSLEASAGAAAGQVAADLTGPALPEAAPPQPILEPLRARIQRAATWTTLAYGATQILRLANNIILAALFVNNMDLLGLMILVAIFMQALQMFSDLGTGPSIIQHRRGDQQEFLNTAWTLQIIRGFGLWIAACIGAWPFAKAYGEPRLTWLIVICGFGMVIQGFMSTSLITLGRKLYLGKLTVLDFTCQILGLIVTIGIALYRPTIWALIIGNTVRDTSKVVASYFMIPGHKNQLGWNREDARDMFKFGRWVFFSTALTFLVFQTDSILFGKLAGPAVLVIYNIAKQFALMPAQFLKRMVAQVAFPMLAEIERERPHMFAQRFRDARLGLVGASMLVLVPLMFGGRLLIDLLYRNEYRDAGWMLQILAAGTMAGIVNSSYGSGFLARGKSLLMMLMQATELVILISAALVGYHFAGRFLGSHWAGVHGFILGVAIVQCLNYPIIAVLATCQKLWQPLIDIPAMVIALAAIVWVILSF
jgi:O-antigen/teichoic acid export membrane protein